MNISEKRRSKVRQIIKKQFDGRVVDFAHGIGRSPAQVWQFLNNRSIGERLARDIETKLGLAHGALDREERTPQGLTAEETELLQNYRRARGSWKLMLERIARIDSGRQQQSLSEALTTLITNLATQAGRRRRPKPK